MPQAEYDDVITIRLNPSMLEKLDKIAAYKNTSRAEIIREALTALIGVYVGMGIDLNAGQPESKPTARA